MIMNPQPTVIDGSALQDWLRTFPALTDFHIIPRDSGQDCEGESKFMSMVDINDDPAITTDPATLAAKDVLKFQRGDYHHIYVSDALDFAVKRGVVTDTFVIVSYSW